MVLSKAIATTHTDAILCCTVLPQQKLLVSGGEDGLVCFNDLDSIDQIGQLSPNKGEDAVTSLAVGAEGHGVTLYVAAGQTVVSLDLRKGFDDTAMLDTYNVNQEEINSISLNAGGNWLAAADDSGEVQLINLAASQTSLKPAYRTLRRGHSNICSSVAFIPNRASELLSGGLDCCIARWDFNRIRLMQHYNLGSETTTASTGQAINPPMVHNIALAASTAADAPPSPALNNNLIALARGDACVAVYDYTQLGTPALTATTSSSSVRKSSSKAKKTSSTSRSSIAPTNSNCTPNKESSPNERGPPIPGLIALLQPQDGGHTSAVNCVCFAPNTNCTKIVSVGNDKRLLLWDWQQGLEQGEIQPPLVDVRHTSKMNWVCNNGALNGYDVITGDVKGEITCWSF